MEVMSESFSEIDSEAAVEKVKKGVYEGRRHRHQPKPRDPPNEQRKIHLNDGLDNFSVDPGKVDTEEGSKDQEDSEH